MRIYFKWLNILRVLSNCIIRFAVLVMLVMLILSCQTSTRKREIKPAEIEEPIIEKLLQIKKKEQEEEYIEWKEYMAVIDHKDFSIDTLIKLTEEYFSAKEIYFIKMMENYEKKLDLYSKGILKKEPEHPEQKYSSLIKDFRELTMKYRYGRGEDTIRYALGYALYIQGEIEEAMKVFEDIVKNYPWSDFLHEVSFRLGELYFDTGQLGEALDTYNVLLDFPDSIFYEKALYKIGWIYFKLDEFEKAVEFFMKVVDRKWRKGFEKEGLLQESIYGIVLSLGHFKSMEQATEYLQSRGLRIYTKPVLSKLGDKLVEETRYEESIIIFNYLADLFSEDYPSLPFIYDKIAGLYGRIDNKEKSIDVKWELVNRYNYTTSWYSKNYPERSEKLDNLISKTIVSISKKSHIRGKKTKDSKDFLKAIEGYNKYIALYPKSPDLREINLLLAEALFDEKKYIEAAKEYEKTALLYPEGIKRGEISYSAFLSYEILFYQAAENNESFISSASQVLNDFRSDFSDINKLRKALYKIAEMYSQAGLFSEARDILAPLIKEEKSIQTYKKIADLYLMEENLVGAEKNYSKILRISGDISIKEKLVKLRYRIAEEHLDAGRFDAAADMYYKSFSVYPGYEIGKNALLRLGNIYIQRENFNELKNVVKNLSKVYPDSDGAGYLLVSAGQKIEKEKPLKAALFYKDASSIAKNSEDGQKLLLAAAILYEKNRNYSKAENLYNNYLLKETTSNEKRADILYRLGNIQLKRGKITEGSETLYKLLRMKDYLDDRIVAKTDLLLLHESMNKYFTIKLQQPFEETLREKTQMLDSILKEYSDLALFMIPELLPEIFFQMGLAVEHFRDSLLQSERPKGLSKDEMEEYNFLLEEKAYPYDDQAVKAYEKSLKEAAKHMIFNKWLEKSLQKLILLRPALYQREIRKKAMKPVFIKPEPVTMENLL